MKPIRDMRQPRSLPVPLPEPVGVGNLIIAQTAAWTNRTTAAERGLKPPPARAMAQSAVDFSVPAL